jgi:hypothetical protein
MLQVEEGRRRRRRRKEEENIAISRMKDYDILFRNLLTVIMVLLSFF